MRIALRVAEKGIGQPTSQPLVGAVVVNDAYSVLATAHRSARPGQSPVIEALDKAGPLPRNSTVLTNIEPFFDSADRGALIERFLEHRPARLVVGSLAPPRRRDGQANASLRTRRRTNSSILERIRNAGIEVKLGVEEKECRLVNEKYYKFSETGLPFVTVKFAQSLDGRIATATGDSQWISGLHSRKLAHKLRREHDAIMVGVKTALTDDPQLTVRLVDGRDPLRVIVDSRLRAPLTVNILKPKWASGTMIATTTAADPEKVAVLRERGVSVLQLPPLASGRVDLLAMMNEFAQTGIASVLVEGGSDLITSLLAGQLVDRLVVAVAPKILGRGIDAVGELGISKVANAITFSSLKTRRLGPDVIFDARLSRTTSSPLADNGTRNRKR
jgi:diaminohydroxyphosphoribosylaminopyrimidine deaminase/5-amino-6-(5-phosphoribosylamino)uracil reductase